MEVIIFTVICKTITFKTSNKLHTVQGEITNTGPYTVKVSATSANIKDFSFKSKNEDLY